MLLITLNFSLRLSLTVYVYLFVMAEVLGAIAASVQIAGQFLDGIKFMRGLYRDIDQATGYIDRLQHNVEMVLGFLKTISKSPALLTASGDDETLRRVILDCYATARLLQDFAAKHVAEDGASKWRSLQKRIKGGFARDDFERLVREL